MSVIFFLSSFDNPDQCRDADSHHFNADPDPAFHFNSDPDPDPAPHLRDHCFVDPPGLHFEPLGLHWGVSMAPIALFCAEFLL